MSEDQQAHVTSQKLTHVKPHLLFQMIGEREVINAVQGQELRELRREVDQLKADIEALLEEEEISAE